jgi:hypothetical protein
VSVTNGSNARAPERQDEVPVLLPFADLNDGVLVERLVGMVVDIELEEASSPVVVAIRDFQITIGCDCDVLMAVYLRVFMSVVNDVVASGLHHLGKLNDLLSISTGNILRAGNCVRKSEQVKPERHMLPSSRGSKGEWLIPDFKLQVLVYSEV